jgi:hypothetical protein
MEHNNNEDNMKLSTSVIAAVCILALVFCAATAQDEKPAFKAKLAEDGENLAAQELWGKWEVKDDFSRFLDPKSTDTVRTEFGRAKVFEFAKSDESTKRILDQISAIPAGMRKDDEKKRQRADAVEHALTEIHAAGLLKLTGAYKDYTIDFALVAVHGNLQLMILETRDDGTYDWESAHVSFVRDAKSDHDLLFIGGDHGDERVACLQRLGVGAD